MLIPGHSRLQQKMNEAEQHCHMTPQKHRYRLYNEVQSIASEHQKRNIVEQPCQQTLSQKHRCTVHNDGESIADDCCHKLAVRYVFFFVVHWYLNY